MSPIMWSARCSAGVGWTTSSPSSLLIALAIFLTTTIPNFTTVGNISDTSRQIGELGLVVVGLTIVMLAGGIDLSVGSNFRFGQCDGVGFDQCREMADRNC